MSSSTSITIEPAQKIHRSRLASLVHFDTYVHRHLDWRHPLDWIGHHPFFVAEQKGRIIAALACPSEVPTVNWIRLFAVGSTTNPEEAWKILMPEVLTQLAKGVQIVGLGTAPWFIELMIHSGFSHENDVVILIRDHLNKPVRNMDHRSTIRRMVEQDLHEVLSIDKESFDQIWQNSTTSLKIAFHQAAIASVVENSRCITGYQICTSNSVGGHLARLAVRPDMQNQGIGTLLVEDLLCNFQDRGIARITVNTQSDNTPSLKLYQKFGFELTGQTFPIYKTTVE